MEYQWYSCYMLMTRDRKMQMQHSEISHGRICRLSPDVIPSIGHRLSQDVISPDRLSPDVTIPDIERRWSWDTINPFIECKLSLDVIIPGVECKLYLDVINLGMLPCWRWWHVHRSQDTWFTRRRSLHSGIHKFSMRCNESWSAPMLVECRLTMERRNALVFFLRDSHIVVDVGFLWYVKSPGMLLCR